MAKLERPVQLAVIGAAHGIKGEVRVKSYTGDPLALGDYGPLADGHGKTWRIAAIRAQGGNVVVRFHGVETRTAAEALAGTPLYVDRSALPQPSEDDEFYHTDLVGLTVRDLEGNVLGTVEAVQNFGAGDMLALRLGTGGSALIPFTAAAVPAIALADGLLTVDARAAGLGDDEEAGR